MISARARLQIAYTSGAYVRIESVESSGRPFSFLAMAAADARAGAAVLGLDWSRVLGHLVTVGEDCRRAPHPAALRALHCHLQLPGGPLRLKGRGRASESIHRMLV